MSPWILAARPKTLPAALMPVILGGALASHDGYFQWVPFSLCVLFALLIQIGTNYANDYFDFRRGADTEERIGPTRAVAAGLVTPEAMLRGTILIFGLAFAFGLGLIAYGGWWLIGLGVVSILCGLAYTGGPYPLAYNGLGDIFVFFFFGIVAVTVTYYVQAGSFSWIAFVASLSMGALTTNLLIVNNVRDIETDRKADKWTLPARFGRRFGELEYAAMHGIALAVPIALFLIFDAAWALLVLLLAPAAVLLVGRHRAAQDGPAYNALLANSAKYLLAYGALLSATLAFSA